MKKLNKVKIYVTCPVENVEEVRLAAGKAGGGVIGNYSYCSFVSAVGKGYFLPMDLANPTIGEIGKHETVDEARIEITCDKEIAKKVVEAIKEAHPYEEVVYDVIELLEI